MNSFFNGQYWKEWPYNLAEVVIDGRDISLKNILPLKLIDACMETCEGRDREILFFRFIDKLTYKQIGEKFEIGPERVRQILARIYRRLRNPRIMNKWISIPYETFMEEREKVNYYEKKYGTINEIEANPRILDILELSVRSYNCCARSGLTNITDFDGLSIRDLANIRNLGRKSTREVIDHLVNYGFVLKREDDDSILDYKPSLYGGMKPITDEYYNYYLSWPNKEE